MHLRVSEAEALELIDAGLAVPMIPKRSAAQVVTVALNVVGGTASLVTLVVSAPQMSAILRRVGARAERRRLEIVEPEDASADALALISELRAILEQAQIAPSDGARDETGSDVFDPP